MKRIEKFDIRCKKIGLRIDLIRLIEDSVKKKGGKIFLVGGNVRDLILDQKIINHPDLVVDLNIKTVIDCLKKSRIKYLKIGEKFGSLVIIMNKLKFDLTSMRRDIKNDGRWAKIKFTDNLIEDSRRRDFTINSIYCDTVGNIYDPNNGIEDLKKKKVRFIGDVKKRIFEDYLRILRFYRFTLNFSGKFDENSLNVCNENLGRLTKLSFERRIKELQQILILKKIEEKKNLLYIKKLLESSLETNLNFKNFFVLCNLERSIDYISYQRRIKFLLRSKKEIPRFLLRNIEKKFKKRLKKEIIFKNYDDLELNLILYKFDKEQIIDQLIIDCSDELISRKRFKEIYRRIESFEKKRLPISGNDLIKIGFKRGKSVGDVIIKIESWWIKNNFSNNKNDCIKYARNFLP
ncbi:MAG: hypothetical protein VX976_01005 [Pseudomonadota bacterium]|nr:hypothetical protein [Pseudomonadota bacterium]